MAEGRIPVTIITGFLGAGKTTLIRKLLTAPHGLRIGLVLNEIGQAGIDQVPEADQAYVELTEGCACCIRSPDLIAALEQISTRRDLDRIILETSGLADPLPLTWLLARPELSDLIRVDSVVTVVDALFLDRAPVEEWGNQVRCADLIVITKRDLVDAALIGRAERAVREVNPQARFLEPGEDRLAELLLDVDVATPRFGSLDAAGARHSDFNGVFLAGAARYDQSRLEDLLEALPEQVFRAKGIVPVADGEWLSFHVVGGRTEVSLDVPPPDHGQGRIAVFGRRLNESEVRAWFMPCEVDG
jgi:G3E family GTPase